MKIIICGTMVPAEFEDKIKELSNAANRFLMNFSRELSQENDIEIYSYLGIDVEGDVLRSLKGAERNIHYFYKTKDKVSGVLKYRQAIKKALNSADCIITYNAVYAWLFVPDLARRMKKKSILILADYAPKEYYVKLIRRFYSDLQLYSIRKYNYVVGLSQNTKVYLQKHQKFLCIEGGVSRQFYDFYNVKKSNVQEIKFMYSGLLDAVTGIDLLIEAFKCISSKACRLIISGKGPMEDYVVKSSCDISNIEFVGLLPYEEYMEKLKEADVLVNPRNMKMLENANNFPSKIMEYIATGKPIISTRFPGNEKFEEYIIFSESTVDDLVEKMDTIMNNKEYSKYYLKNREYAKKFLWKEQVKKFMDLVTE